MNEFATRVMMVTGGLMPGILRGYRAVGGAEEYMLLLWKLLEERHPAPHFHVIYINK
jgi:hypothetical protein